MTKPIIRFGQDLYKEEFYNLIVKVSEIGDSELSDITDEILQRGFTIYHINENRVEACFKNRYKEVSDKYRKLDNAGWGANVD